METALLKDQRSATMETNLDALIVLLTVDILAEILSIRNHSALKSNVGI